MSPNQQIDILKRENKRLLEANSKLLNEVDYWRQKYESTMKFLGVKNYERK